MKEKSKNKKQNNNMKIFVIIGIAIGIVLSVTTSYILAESLINSKDVYYQDNSELGVTSVQEAIDGTCTKFSNQLTSLKSEILNETYPVGSVYISFTNTNPSTLFGGTWEEIENGRVLRSTNTTSGQKAGYENVTLKVENLPSHNHTISHTHTIYGIQAYGTTSVFLSMQDDGNLVLYKNNYEGSLWSSGTTFSGANNYFGVRIGMNGTSSAASTNVSGSTGSGTAFSVLDPYITVYMWKRTK